MHSSSAILHQIGGLNGRLTVQTWVLLSAFACSSLDIVDMAGKTKIMDPKFGSLQRHLLELSWPIFRDYGLVNIFLGNKIFLFVKIGSFDKEFRETSQNFSSFRQLLFPFFLSLSE